MRVKTDSIICFGASERILVALLKNPEQYISKIVDMVGTTYSTTFLLLRSLENQNIVATTKNGRERYAVLTPKGEKIANALKTIHTTLGEEGTPVIFQPSKEAKKEGKLHIPKLLCSCSNCNNMGGMAFRSKKTGNVSDIIYCLNHAKEPWNSDIPFAEESFVLTRWEHIPFDWRKFKNKSDLKRQLAPKK